MSAPANNLNSMGGGGDGSCGGSCGGEAVRISSECVVAAIIFFFMVVVVAFFFYLYAKRRVRSAFLAQYRASFASAGTAADLGTARGLDAAVLRALPATVYRAPEFEEGVECAVCLSELAGGEVARVLPVCGHGFHRECIDVWFRSHSTCPLCRSPVARPKQIPVSGSSTETPIIPPSGLSATPTAAERAGDGVVIEIQGAEEDGLGSSAASTAAREETTTAVAATMRTLTWFWSYSGGNAAPAETSSSADERSKH